MEAVLLLALQDFLVDSPVRGARFTGAAGKGRELPEIPQRHPSIG